MNPRAQGRARAARAPSPRVPHPAFPASGTARALFASLAVTLLLRAAATFAPGRYLWGLDLGRDLAPAAFWLPWAACALALSRGISARFLAGSLRHPRLLPVATILVVLASLGLFPERAFLTGDTSIRHGEFAEMENAAAYVPQALPADLILHHTLPRAVARDTGLTVERVGRLWDALLAALLVIAAWDFARLAARRGAGRFAAFGAASFTAALTLFNGYAKSIVEMNVLVMFALAALLRIARDGSGVMRLGLATAGALLLHRSALAWLPAWVLGLAVARAREPGAWRRPTTWLAASLPIAALAATGPRSFRTIATFDLTHHLDTAMRSGHAWPSWLAADLAPAHLLQVSQVALLTVPLAIPLAVLLISKRGLLRRREMLLLSALAIPQLAIVLLVHPQQGYFRDWDVFTAGAIAVSGLLAWLVAEVLDTEPAVDWLALPVVLCALVPSLQWLAHQADVPRALTRASSILRGPPERSATERSSGYDHIGIARFQRGEHALALEAFQRSILAAPNPHVFVEAGMAEAMLGRPGDALAYYLEAVRRDANQVMGWRGVAASSSALGDLPHMQLAESALSRLDPDGPTTLDARAYLASHAARAP